VNRLDDSLMYLAERLAELFRHVCSKKSLGILKALQAARRIDALWNVNPG
jgi:hypothetical protein